MKNGTLAASDRNNGWPMYNEARVEDKFAGTGGPAVCRRPSTPFGFSLNFLYYFLENSIT